MDDETGGLVRNERVKKEIRRSRNIPETRKGKNQNRNNTNKKKKNRDQDQSGQVKSGEIGSTRLNSSHSGETRMPSSA